MKDKLRLLFLLVLALCGALFAQNRAPVTWSDDLQQLEAKPTSMEVMKIRDEVAGWLKQHPNSNLSLAPAPAQPWTEEQASQQAQVLHSLIEAILRQDPNHPFHLGIAEVQVTDKGPNLSLVTDSIDQSTIRLNNAVTAAKSLDYLPGVSVQHIDGNRNEAGIMIRGFSTRGQVPLYLDGVPIYVPYDGYVDFNRFLTSDLAEIDVSRGISSPLLGPNGLGGSINMVTREPVKRWEGDMLTGTASGNGLLSSLHLGSSWPKFFAQGSVDWNQADYIPLSGNFALNSFQPTYDRNQSYFRDEKYSGRIGWKPRAKDEYVFSYINQKGQKGVPLYAGPNSAAVFKMFWKWPYWNKDSYYFLSNTGIGDQSWLKFRVFYDQFRNSIDMFDNATYTTMKNSSSEHSRYDDHTDGASTEFTTHRIARNIIGASFFFKDDTHRERGVYPGRSPYPLVQPALVDRDQQISVGLQDSITLTERISASVGFSSDHLNGMQAQAYNAAGTALIPVTCLASTNNKKFSGCTAHVWNNNPQASLTYSISSSDTAFVTFSDTGRFPMLKDSYSYSMGKGIPNPDLKPEHSRNWNIGYDHLFPVSTRLEVVLYRSDLRNAIESVYIPDTNSICLTNTGGLSGYCLENVNIGKEVHEGVEMSVHSTPISWVTFDGSYSYLNRTIEYKFSDFPDVSRVNTTVQILPTLPKNKLIGSVTARLPHQALASALVHYEGGLTVQDTTYSSTSPRYRPFSTCLSTVELNGSVPFYRTATLQTGVKNLLDRNYFFTPGYPQEGRNWYLNLRYRF